MSAPWLPRLMTPDVELPMDESARLHACRSLTFPLPLAIFGQRSGSLPYASFRVLGCVTMLLLTAAPALTPALYSFPSERADVFLPRTVLAAPGTTMVSMRHIGSLVGAAAARGVRSLRSRVRPRASCSLYLANGASRSRITSRRYGMRYTPYISSLSHLGCHPSDHLCYDLQLRATELSAASWDSRNRHPRLPTPGRTPDGHTGAGVHGGPLE